MSTAKDYISFIDRGVMPDQGLVNSDQGRAALESLHRCEGIDAAALATVTAWVGALVDRAGVEEVTCTGCGALCLDYRQCGDARSCIACATDEARRTAEREFVAAQAADNKQREDRHAEQLKAARRDEQRAAQSVAIAYMELHKVGGEELVDQVAGRARVAMERLDGYVPTYWELYGMVEAAQGVLRGVLAELEDKGTDGVAHVVDELNALLEGGHLTPDVRRLGQWLGEAGTQDEQAAFLAAFAAELVAMNPDRPTACQTRDDQISAIVEDLLGDGDDVPAEAVNVLRLCQQFLDRLEAALPSPHGDAAACDGVALIAAERRRQVTKEGWSLDHDDKHDDRSLAVAAACYAAPYAIWPHQSTRGAARDAWPWGAAWDKRVEAPTIGQRIRELSKAGALCAAEIARLLRAERAGTRLRSPANSGVALKELSSDHAADCNDGAALGGGAKCHER